VVVWWIVAAVVVLPLLGLVAVVSGLRRRLAELDRVATLVNERLAGATARIQAGMEAIRQRSVALRRRLPAPGSRRR